jgi:hypothetical protein
MGRTRKTPRRERLTQTFPRLSDKELKGRMAAMAEISKAVSSIAELGGEKKLRKAIEAKMIQESHLRLN